MDINFSDWLVEMMKDRQWTQADFSRATGLTRQAISYYLSGKSKQPDEFALQKIAKALNLPPEEVYRAAGIPLSPPAPDATLYRIEHLYHTLKEDSSKSRALEFLEFLSQQEGKNNDRKGKKPNYSPTSTPSTCRNSSLQVWHSRELSPVS